MSSQSQPDPAWVPTPETSVFTGGSLDVAVADARAHLGPGAQIRAARRVRQGLRGRVRFEVLAAPDPSRTDDLAPAAGGQVATDANEQVDLTLTELLAAADESEAAALMTSEPEEPVPVPQPPPSDEDFTALVQAALQRVALQDEAPAGAGPHPAPELLDAVAGVLRPGDDRAAAVPPVAPPVAPTVTPALTTLLPSPRQQVPAAGPQPRERRPISRARWSVAALAEAGVPAEVLDRIPPLDPLDDLGWLTALRDAISAVVPAPATPGEPCDAIVDGAGTAGAVLVLRAGLLGITPGTLTVDGRALPATAAELALTVRSCVLC